MKSFTAWWRCGLHFCHLRDLHEIVHGLVEVRSALAKASWGTHGHHRNAVLTTSQALELRSLSFLYMRFMRTTGHRLDPSVKPRRNARQMSYAADRQFVLQKIPWPSA